MKRSTKALATTPTIACSGARSGQRTMHPSASRADPNQADSDGDGLVDGADVEFVAHAVEPVPVSCFKSTGAGSQDAVLAILEAVEASLLDGHEGAAIEQLSNLHARVDGCGWAADNNDWITDCAAQLTIRSLIELLTTNITT